MLKRYKRNKKKKKKQSIISKVTGTVSTAMSVELIAKFIAIMLVVIIAISIFSGIACVILAIVQIAQGVVNTLTGLDTDVFEDTTVQVKPGAQYIWNVQDLEKMPDEWSKNLYLLAWLANENKAAQSSNMPINLLLGIPVLETGSKFYPTGDDHGAGFADGTDKNWNNYSISEQATVGGAFPYKISSDYISGIYACDAKIVQQQGLAKKATWGKIPHTKLATDTLGLKHTGYITTYARGDVEQSIYSPAVSVAVTIHLYENSKNSVFNKDADYGYAHQYKKYWLAACEKYELDPNDKALQEQAYAMFYYLVHAGGVWSAKDIADDFYYMAWDYVLFVYKNVAGGDLNNISLTSNYTVSDTLRRLDSTVLKAAARGDDNTNHDGAVKWNVPIIKKTYLQRKTNDGAEYLTKSLVELWMDYNNTHGFSDVVENYIKIYTHNNKFLVRQGEYAVSTGCMAVFAGNARLDYIFDILGIEYVVNQETGYVCYASYGTFGVSGPVPNGYRDGVFDTENSKKKGYSNYRDVTWFATLDNNEWANPLNPNINGGFKVTSRYGYRYLDSSNPWDWHSGMDFAYWKTTENLEVLRSSYPVYAMHDGEITFVNAGLGSTGGRYLHYKVTYVRNGEPVTRYITYMHLSGFTSDIESEIAKQLGGNTRGNVSIPVKCGMPIAYMGGSGKNSEEDYAVHLHISLSKNPAVNSNYGRLDMETELPFVTMYSNYDSWWQSNDVSGYLKQKPATAINSNGADPQAS